MASAAELDWDLLGWYTLYNPKKKKHTPHTPNNLGTEGPELQEEGLEHTEGPQASFMETNINTGFDKNGSFSNSYPTI